MSYAKRLSRLQRLQEERLQEELILRMAAEAGAPYGLSAEEVIDEATILLTWPPELLERELATFREDKP
jgi:hypothetical protein